MSGPQIAVVIFVPWFIGLVLNMAVRTAYPQTDDTHTAVGKSILWPLYVLRFVGLALYKGGKALLDIEE